jgi:hypothetical protein
MAVVEALIEGSMDLRDPDRGTHGGVEWTFIEALMEVSESRWRGTLDGVKVVGRAINHTTERRQNLTKAHDCFDHRHRECECGTADGAGRR